MLPRLSALVSGVDCPCPFFHANLSVRLSLSSRQMPSLLSSHQLLRCLVLTAPPWIHANSAVRLSPVQPPTASAGSRRQLSFASPYHFRIRRDFVSKNPLSGFAPKQTRLLWRPTHIVLHHQNAIFKGLKLNTCPPKCHLQGVKIEHIYTKMPFQGVKIEHIYTKMPSLRG